MELLREGEKEIQQLNLERGEEHMTKKERYTYILDYFRKTQPIVESELRFGSEFQLLVAVILSAQCTDKRINEVTPELFRNYPDAKSMAQAGEVEIYEYIKSVTYPNAKARNIAKMAQMLVEKHNGAVPNDMNDLLDLPGVGRKTANVVQAVAFRKSAMAVDTHIYRVSHRLGLVPATCNTPYKVEMELQKNIPDEDIPDAHHWLLLHGRYTCKSLKPLCNKCELEAICPKKLENSKLKK